MIEFKQGTAGTLVVHYNRHRDTGEILGQKAEAILEPGDPGNYLGYLKVLIHDAPYKLPGIEFVWFVYPLNDAAQFGCIAGKSGTPEDPRNDEAKGIFWHECTEPGCTRSVEFDDEPKCFTHSPDEGSSMPGYSARAEAGL